MTTARLTHDFRGCPDNEIYPVRFRKGDTVEGDLAVAAIAAGVAKKARARREPDAKTTEAQSAPAPDALVGSSIVPAEVTMPDGKTVVKLDDVVRAAFEALGASVEEWNGIDEDAREQLIAEQLETLAAAHPAA